MKNKKLVIIFSILTIIWMGLIFAFSATPAKESDNESKAIIRSVVGKISDKDSNRNTEKYVDTLNKPFRKTLHATEYFILAGLIFMIFINIKDLNKLFIFLDIFICFLYACSDEFHQKFIIGRSPQFSDVLIDTIGSIICVGLFSFIYYKRKKLSK